MPLLYDRLEIVDTKRTYTDEGFMSAPARIARTGVQTYTALEMGISDRDATDSIKVFRPADEVFNVDSLASFANKPITDNHPPELITADNYSEFSIGHAGNTVSRVGDFAETLLFFTSAEAIEKVKTGKVELSNGYTADIEWVSGKTEDGETYDAIQRKIKGNHIAIVERGRAGPNCRVADNLLTGDTSTMAKIKIDDIDYDVSDQALQAVSKLQIKLADTENKLEKEKEKSKEDEDEKEELKKKVKKTEDSLQAKIDDGVSKIPSIEMLDKMVNDRVIFINKIKCVAPDIKWEGKDATVLKKEIVVSKFPDIKINDVSQDYIDARFDIIMENVNGDSQTTLDDLFSKTVIADNTKDNRPQSVIARDNMIERNRNAWKPKGDK